MAATGGSRFSQVTLILVIFGLSIPPTQAQYGGGEGESNDPYLIYTAEQLNAIGINPADWDKHFRLMADIDLASLGGTQFNIIGGARETRSRGLLITSGSPSVHAADDVAASAPFRGVFDGGGHTISGFVYTSAPHGNVGLFGTVADPNAEIRNLTLIAPRIDITGAANAGSLVGYLKEGTLTNCHAENADVRGDWESVGGLVGRSGLLQSYPGTSVTIRNCSCTGRVSCDFSAVGGLVGYDTCGHFDQCFAACEVTGKDGAGGLVGMASGYPASITFINCYSVGSVTGRERVGGLLGYADMAAIFKCYAVGRITGTEYVGAFIGRQTGGVHMAACFWHAEIIDPSGQVESTGRTTAEMQDPNTFMAAGWDFVGKPDGPSDIWAEPGAGGYPVLWWQLPEPPTFSFSGGTGTADDPYLIATAEQLNSIGYNPRLMGAHFRVTNNVDLSGLHFYPIGSGEYPFRGVFDGEDFIISNFTYTVVGRQAAGLFRAIEGRDAEVQNVRLESPVISGADAQYVGSLVGRLTQGTLRNCHVTGGRVSGSSDVGGLVGATGTFGGTGGSAPVLAKVLSCDASLAVVGQDGIGGLVGTNAAMAMVSDCLANSDVRGQWDVGGLAGRNHIAGVMTDSCAIGTVAGTKYVGGLVGGNRYSKIQRCFSTAQVQGNARVGGLAGWNYGEITDCYAIAEVTGNDRVGGLVGHNGSITTHSSDRGTIANCYSASRLSGRLSVGGLVGYNEFGEGKASFWDIQTSGQQSSAGGIGKTTAQMQMAATFLDAGWDFVDETSNGTEDIWWILEGQDYPRLNWERDKQP